MGCSKNYIMYWGGYVYYNSIGDKISLHKHKRISKAFLCISRTAAKTPEKIGQAEFEELFDETVENSEKTEQNA